MRCCVLWYIVGVTTSKRSKLTLVVDPSVVQQAKTYAAAHKTSVSTLVETYLRNLTADQERDMSFDPSSWAPTTRSLYGALTESGDVDPDTLKRQYLYDKYLHD